jgi:transcriptional regulator with XRE-family HTH domain
MVVKARLADIAAQAGVSEATVSRVLNGKPGVSVTTRDAVLTALDLLGGERPARLKQRRLGLIGLIIPELENPIFPMFAQVIERDLTQAGYTTVLCTQSPGGATEDDYVELLLERAISGIIFVSGLHADTSADQSRYDKLVVPAAADRDGQRRGRHGQRSLYLRGRGGRGRARRVPPGLAGPPPDRPGGRPGAVRAGAAQGRGVRAGHGGGSARSPS